MKAQPLFSANRLEAFSDGVLAIIITLIVLEVKLPHGTPEAALGTALLGLVPKVVSWVISFGVLGVFWVNHHRLFSQLKAVDAGLLWLNLLTLLMLSLSPFPTSLMGEYPDSALAVSLFGGTMVLASLAFACMRWYATHHPKLLKSGSDQPAQQWLVRRSFLLGPVAWALATAAVLLHPFVALGCYAFIPLFFVTSSSLPQADADN